MTKRVALTAVLVLLAVCTASPPAAADAAARRDSLAPAPVALDEQDAARLSFGLALGLWSREAPGAALEQLALAEPARLDADAAARTRLLQALAAAAAGDTRGLNALLDAPPLSAAPALDLIALASGVDPGHDATGAPPLLAALAVERALAANDLDRAAATLAECAGRLPEALRLQLAARLADRRGDADAGARWLALARHRVRADWERPLVADAALRALARDPQTELAAASDAPNALRVRALASLAAGDSVGARASLAPLPADDPSTLLRARLALDADDPDAAWRDLTALEAARAAERGRLVALDPDAAADSLLALAARSGLSLAPWSRDALLAALDAAASDRRERLDGAGRKAGEALEPAATDPAPLSLAPAQRRALEDARSALGAAGLTRQRAEAARDARVADRSAWRRHLAAMLDSLNALDTDLRSTAAGLDTLDLAARRAEAGLASLLGDYQAWLLARVDAVARRAALHDEAFAALDRLRLDGPRARRPRTTPLDLDSLVVAERSLAGELRDFAALHRARVPVLLAEGLEQRWAPRLRHGPSDAAARGDTLLANADALAAHLRRLAAAPDSLELALAQALARAEANESSAARELRAARRDAAASLIEQRLAAMDVQQEALDYQLAEAALSRSRRADDDALAAVARERIAAFLAAHPGSTARAEMRFALAELRLDEAHASFNAAMARFLGAEGAADEAAAQALAPFLDVTPACALYRSLLDEDQDFARRDEVLFNLGMLLDDAGDPDGEPTLQRLLKEWPESPTVPRARLRLAERAMARGDAAAAAAHYAAVAERGAPEQARVALYTLAWIRFQQDRFLDAAELYRRLIDLELRVATTDPQAGALESESRRHLAESLARAGGAPAFASFFAGSGERDWSPALLTDMGRLLRGYGFHARAAAADSLWLERHPLAPAALAQAQLLLGDLRAAGDSARADGRLADLTRRFLPGGAWDHAVRATDDSLAEAGGDFARACALRLAAQAQTRARATDDPAAWRELAGQMDLLLAHWADDAEHPARLLLAGETAARLGDMETALARYGAAAAADSSLAPTARWQSLALLDAAQTTADSTAAPAALARFLAAGEDFLAAHPRDERAAGLLWRLAALREANAMNADAAEAFQRFARRWPENAAAPLAAARSGDALARDREHAAAAARYAEALVLARAAGNDSLTTALAERVPASQFLAAEASVAADSSDCAGARRFEALASDWPAFDQADEAWYRAGLAYEDCGETAAAGRAWAALSRRAPGSPLRGDALLRLAAQREQADPRAAAAALASYALEEASADEAPEALLRAVDLCVGAGAANAADSLRDRFLARFPEHPASLTEILRARALAALDARGDAPIPDPGALDGPLADYLAGAAARPELGDPELLARVDYLVCLSLHARFADIELDGAAPLATQLERKQAALTDLAERSRAVLARGNARWSRASAHLLGQSLYEFGDALLALEAPPSLSGDDALAYLEVLEDQAWQLYSRGESTWSELVRLAPSGDEDPDNWVSITKTELWPRIARRFLHLPELDYPLVQAEAPPWGS